MSLAAGNSRCSPLPGWTHSRLINWLAKNCEVGCWIWKSLSMVNMPNVPIDSLHPESARKSAQIWCAADRNKAWDDWFDTGKLPDNKGDCPTPIAQTAALGQKYHVNATPTLVFADGSVIPGALPLTQLESELKQADAKKPAAAIPMTVKGCSSMTKVAPTIEGSDA